MVLPKKVTNYISRNIRKQRHEGKPEKQAIAISFSKARKEFPEYDEELREFKIKKD